MVGYRTIKMMQRLVGFSFRTGRTIMDPKTSALERAFQLAKSGQVSKVDDIKPRLKREGYDANDVFLGQSLRVQLAGLIKAAKGSAHQVSR